MTTKLVIDDVTPTLLAAIQALIKDHQAVDKEDENKCKCITDSSGTKRWRNKAGQLHRDGDLPAVESADGSKNWRKNGTLHRDNDLPAIEEKGGTKVWLVGGKRSRANGKPAIVQSDGYREWWVDDVLQAKFFPGVKFVVVRDGKEEEFSLD